MERCGKTFCLGSIMDDTNDEDEVNWEENTTHSTENQVDDRFCHCLNDFERFNADIFASKSMLVGKHVGARKSELNDMNELAGN